jgi:hypothetical protein
MTEQWTADASTLRREAAKPLTQIEIEQRVFDLYDEYCHGHIDRREFLSRAAAVTIGGLAMAQALLPRYAQAQTISFTDPRIKARYMSYPSRPGRPIGTPSASVWSASVGALADRSGSMAASPKRPSSACES